MSLEEEMGRGVVTAWQTQEQLAEWQAQRKRLLRALINCLSSKRQKHVMRMHYGILVENALSHDEIAEVLGITTAQVDDLYSKGMLELKRFAHEMGSWVESERAAAKGIAVTSRTRH